MAAPGASEMVVVVTGGDAVDPAHLPPMPPGTPVVAADSGIDQAHALGLVVDVAIGDFDSVSATGLAHAESDGARVDRHPVAKDATDLELALDAALALAPARVHVLGGHGGRLDHLLARPAYAAVAITAQMGAAHLTIVRRQARLEGSVGGIVSLIPLHGPAIGVTTAGLLYPLVDEDLGAGSTRGVSNELTHPVGTVTIRRGVLAAVQPGSLGPHHQENLP